MPQLAEWVETWETRHPGGLQIDRVPVRDAFELAFRLEARAADMYCTFARVLGANDATLTNLWLDMAVDEEKHVNALSLARSYISMRETVALLVDRRALLKLSRLLDRGVEEAEKEGFDHRRALQMAWDVESSEMDYLMDLLTELPERYEVRERIEELKRTTAWHREKLEEIAMHCLGPQAPISQWDRP